MLWSSLMFYLYSRLFLLVMYQYCLLHWYMYLFIETNYWNINCDDKHKRKLASFLYLGGSSQRLMNHSIYIIINVYIHVPPYANQIHSILLLFPSMSIVIIYMYLHMPTNIDVLTSNHYVWLCSSPSGTSPFTMEGISQGPHTLIITPATTNGCRRRISRVISFNVE